MRWALSGGPAGQVEPGFWNSFHKRGRGQSNPGVGGRKSPVVNSLMLLLPGLHEIFPTGGGIVLRHGAGPAVHAGPMWPLTVGTGKPRGRGAEPFLIRAVTSWPTGAAGAQSHSRIPTARFFEHLCLRFVAGSAGMSVTTSPHEAEGPVGKVGHKETPRPVRTKTRPTGR